jgi:hypothetical protein
MRDLRSWDHLAMLYLDSLGNVHYVSLASTIKSWDSLEKKQL